MKKKFTILFVMLAYTATAVIAQRHSTSGHTVASDGNIANPKLYVFGGSKHGFDPTNELWIMDIHGNQTFVMSNPNCILRPAARSNHISWMNDGYLYISGGVNESNNCLSDTWMYNPLTNCWTQLQNTLPCASKQTATIIDNKAYIFGGLSSDGSSLASLGYINLGNIPAGYMPGTPLVEGLAGSGSFAIGGTVNIFGGLNPDYDLMTPGNQPSYSQNTWKYTPGSKSGSWTGVTTTGTIKELTDMAYTQDPLKNFFYVFGGKSYDYGTSTEIFSNEIFKLDLNTNVWTKLATKLPQPLAEFTATYIHVASLNSDIIYLLGGVTATGTISEYLYKFNVTTNALTTVPVAVSVNDISAANKNLSLFPNPVSDVLTIKIMEKEQITKIEIINSLGKIVQSIDNPTSREINLSQQNSGLYFIRVDTKTTRYFNKLIKQ